MSSNGSIVGEIERTFLWKERNPSLADRYMREHMHEDEEATAAVGAAAALAKEGSHR